MIVFLKATGFQLVLPFQTINKENFGEVINITTFGY